MEGSLRTRKWTDQQTGQERYATEIRADTMQMLGSRQGMGGGQAGGYDDGGYGGDAGGYDQAPARRAAPPQRPAAPPQRPTPAPAPMAPAPRAASGFDDMDDDIPF